MIVTAKLVKQRSDDGFVEMHDNVPLGKVYKVDANSRRYALFIHTETGHFHTKEIIDEYPSGKYLVMELLELGGAPE